MDKFDIAIIGLGPAGATLARLLSPRFKVIAIDKKTPGKESPFTKPCGGLLAPDAQKALAAFALTLPKEILVDPQIFAVHTIDAQTRLKRKYQRFYLNLDRHKFDNWLISLIPNTVTIFKDAACTAINKTSCGFEVAFSTRGQKHKVQAKYLIGADGADSFVRRFLRPGFKAHRYSAIQQWFKEAHPVPFYSCIFDSKISDCYSWSISKDGYFIFGGAYPAQHSRKFFEEQKQILRADFGFKFSKPLKTEACAILRPASLAQFYTGAENVFLVGEAAGFISPSSLEGISSAFESALILSQIFNADTARKNAAYFFKTLPLRLKLFCKLFKCPFLYNPFLRKLVMLSGLKAIGQK